MQHFLRAQRVDAKVRAGGSTYQQTLSDIVTIEGIGVHSGSPVSINLLPASSDHGIVFRITNSSNNIVDIPAHFSVVSNVTLCTVLSDETGASVSTVEHLMAALSAMAIDNVIVEINSGEVPILDGSSIQFMDAFEQVGLAQQDKVRRYIKVIKKVRVEVGDSWAELNPHDGFRLDVEIDFETPVIGRQRFIHDLSSDGFRDELASARTFGFMKDVELLWKHGRALGSSLDNTVAIGDKGIVNPDGLRFADEFVRHKTLDAVGDLALAGAPLLAEYSSYKGGHAVNHKILETLFATPDAFIIVDAETTLSPAANVRDVAAVNFASLP